MEIKKLADKLLSDPLSEAKKMNVKDLESVLRYFSDVYYNTGKSLIPDEIFDAIKDILREKNPKNKFLKEVGSPVKKGEVKLPYFMGSLEKIKVDEKELDKWTKKYKGPYVISDKLDGVSALIYKDGDTIKMFSRGDGDKGQDITHLLKYVMPKDFNYNALSDKEGIRGEMIITKKDFIKIADEMKNARNAVAGLANAKHINLNVAKITKFIAYSIMYPTFRQSDQMKELIRLGFDTVTYKVEKAITTDSLSKYLLERKEKSLYEMDGLVVEDDSEKYQILKGNPEHAFAFKMVLKDQIMETTVEAVEWTASMDGLLKPRIRVKPVNLGGTTISYASAFNAKYIVDNKLGPGAVIKIIRSGDVIPYILEIIKPAKEPQMPNEPYKWNKSGVDIIVKDLFGSQKDIITVKKMDHFFSTLGIKFIGEGILKKFVDAGYNTLFKLLKADRIALTKIEGVGEKLVAKIFSSIEERLKDTNIYTLMDASHLFGHGLGERKLKLVFDEYPNILEEKWDKKTMIEKLNLIKGYSDITTDKFVDNLETFKKFLDELSKIYDLSYLKQKIKKKVVGNLFENQIVVMTGFRNEEVKKLIESNGGKVTDSVSSNTTLVIYALSVGNSAKLQKAKELKIKIITEDEFKKKYNL